MQGSTAAQHAAACSGETDGGCDTNLAASPPAWQQFHKGYKERFVLDCCIRLLCNDVVVRVAQAPSAKRAQQPQQAKTQQQNQQQRVVAAQCRGRVRSSAAAARGAGRGAKAVVQGSNAKVTPKPQAVELDRESDPALTGSTVWDG